MQTIKFWADQGSEMESSLQEKNGLLLSERRTHFKDSEMKVEVGLASYRTWPRDLCPSVDACWTNSTSGRRGSGQSNSIWWDIWQNLLYSKHLTEVVGFNAAISKGDTGRTKTHVLYHGMSQSLWLTACKRGLEGKVLSVEDLPMCRF